MKKLIILIGIIFLSSFAFAQEYDDMYFNKRDRKKQKKVLYESNRKHINPEYIARYTTKPKVKVVVQSYYKPYYYNYNSWNWNISFGYHYGYDPFYSWGYTPHFYGWNYPRFYYHYGHYNSFYSYYYYPHYGYNHYNYGYMHSYGQKQYITKHKAEVNYKSRNINYYRADKTTRTVDYSKIRKPQQTRVNKDVRSRRISTYTNRPTYKPKSSKSRSTQYRSTNKQSNTNQYRSTKSSSYSAPSRSRSSYTAPSRSRSNSPSPSRSSRSSRGRRQ